MNDALKRILATPLWARGLRVEIAKDSYDVARVSTTINDSEEYARLFAAAPNLLATLKEIAETPKNGEPCPDDPTYTQSWDSFGLSDRLHEMIDAARAAIAKAQGTVRMPTLNPVDLLDCAAGHHDFGDDAEHCRVCGKVEDREGTDEA